MTERKMIEKVSAIFFMLIISITLLQSCAPADTDIEKQCNINISSADKIVIRSGMTGKESVITGNKNLQDFLNMFKGAKVTGSTALSRNSSGYCYAAALYKHGKCTGGFYFGGPVIIVPNNKDLTEYKISKYINSAMVDKKYKLYRDKKNN